MKLGHVLASGSQQWYLNLENFDCNKRLPELLLLNNAYPTGKGKAFTDLLRVRSHVEIPVTC